MKNNYKIGTLNILKFKNIIKSLVYVIISLFLFNNHSKAQSQLSSMGVSGFLPPIYTTSDSSDYKVFVKFKNVSGKVLPCKNRSLSIVSYKDSIPNPFNLWFMIKKTAPDTTLNGNRFFHVDSNVRDTFFVTGPSVVSHFYTAFLYNGTGPDYSSTCKDCFCAQKDASDFNLYHTFTRASKIKPPKNVYATKDTSESFIEIKWKKGTNIPDTGNMKGTFLNLVFYKVYRNDTLIATLNGDQYHYRDSGLRSGKSYKYRVTTFTDKFGTGNHESDTSISGTWAIGKTFNASLVASDNEFSNKTVLKWSDMSKLAESIEVNRIENDTAVQIAVLDAFSKTYSDLDGIPGYTYLYSVKPLKKGFTYSSYSDSGTRKVNGIISGKVVSPLNAGVEGVIVHAEANVKVNGSIKTVKYSDTTDNAGYYEIKDIYYHKNAEFTIRPEKPKHSFKISSLKRTLNLDNPKIAGIDFIDTSVFSVIGKISYPVKGSASAISCGISGVKILLNGKEVSRSDDTGRYAFTINEEGNYIITPQYLHHHFSKPNEKLFIKSDTVGLNFLDIETDSILIKVIGGCNTSICDYALVRIQSVKGESCYDTTIKTNPDGFAKIILSSREYNVKVVDIFPKNTNRLQQIGRLPIKVNLASRDSTVELISNFIYDTIPDKIYQLPDNTYDTIKGSINKTEIKDSFKVAKQPRADFIYTAPIKVDVNFADVADDMVCLGKEKIPMMTKGSVYNLVFSVYEEESKCPIKDGILRIYDQVGDKEKKTISVDIKDGVANYQIIAGLPNISTGGDNPHQKSFFFVTEVGFLDPLPQVQWVLVTGAKPRDQTFITKSPGIPLLILHDPPGDGSYAFIEKGTTITKTLEMEHAYGGDAGFKMDITAGSGVQSLFGKVAAGFHTEFSVKAGSNGSDINTRDVSLTFNERFSTTDAEDICGYPGDVFIGASFNMLYALADVVEFDSDSCKVDKTINLIMDPNGFATTFIYTESFIENSIIPRLQEIVELSTPDYAEAFKLDIKNWQTMIDSNRANRDTKAVKLPGDKGNISISYGAAYEATSEYDSSTTNSHTFGTYFDSELFIGAKLETLLGAWVESSIGAIVDVNYSFNQSETSTTQEKTIVGYHISDNDPGDYHSIDILKDVAYGVPAFRLVSGATCCPHEENTQRRDLASISISPEELNNIPNNKPAVFTLNVVNESQSFEARDYQIILLPESNPDGAIVRLNGQNINFFPANLRINPFQQTKIQLTVERGPMANNYHDLKLVMISPCEYEYFDNTSADTIKFDVNFQNDCSNIEIYSPAIDWIHNSSNGDYMDIALTGYDQNLPLLSSLKLEYLREGMGWTEVLEIPKNELRDKFFDTKFMTKYIPDGNYKLRAAAQCTDSKGYINSINYSEIINGKIERKPLEMFGTPYPKNGILNYGEDIWIEFDKDINTTFSYYPGKIALQNVETKEFIPLTYTINKNKLIIKPNSVSLLDGLEGKLLKATVIQIRDLNGNATPSPIEWTFKVNRSPIYWQNRFLTVSAESGSTGKVIGRLINAGISDGTFTNLIYPIDKIVPNQSSGTIAAGSFQDIEFSTKPDLTPGLYKDSIMVQSGSYLLKTYIQIEILSTPPRWINQTIDPAKYEDRMNFVLQFSTDNQLDIPLSSDIKDVIGVFYKDSLRGKANIEYNPQLRKYYAYLTAYGNGDKFDSLSFRMWDAFPGIQYRAKESKLFKDGALIGQVNSPFILHPIGVYQTINLKKGWNWLALFVKNSNQTPDGIFKQMMKDTSTLLKTQNAYSHFGGDRWYGNIDSLKAGIGYLLNSPKTDTIEIYGSTYGGEIKSIIEGNQNWSWVGNADQFGSTVTNKLSNLKASNNDIIIGETTFATFDGTNWNGSLNYLEPGSAYKIKTALPGEFINQKLNKTLPIWNLDFNGFEHNMNVTAEIFKGSNRVFDSHYLVGAFVNGVCHGVAQPVYSEKLNRYLVFLTVFGDNTHFGQNITLKLFDTDLGVEIPQSSKSFTFNKESIYGSIPDPYDIVINSAGINNFNKIKSTVVCYPNPFNTEININLNIPKAGNVEVMITDAIGRTLESLHNGKVSPGNHNLTWDASKYPQGIYFCITKINGEIIRTTIMKK